MTSSGEIREILRKCLPEIREKYGVTSIGIFGSYARGEAAPASDIDIIVEFDRPIGWELVDLADYLESILHHKVDLVIRRSLHPLIRDTILAEVQVRMTARSPVYPPESAIKPEFVRQIIKARSEIENGLGMSLSFYR